MATEDSGGKWRKVIVVGVVILLILMILIGLLSGLYNLKRFFTWLLIGLLIIGILFGLAYAFWIIFLRREYQDIPANFRKKLVHTARLMKNEMLGNLYLTGDSKHNRIKLGKFAYLRMKFPKRTVEYIETKQKGEFGEIPVPKEVVKSTLIDIDCFIIIKDKIMDKLFGDPIFILVRPEDHDYGSVFNDVHVNGFNLVPLDSQFYTINTRNMDSDLKRALSVMYQSEVVDEIFRNLDRLVKMSMNLDQEHQKSKEKASMFDIPQITVGDQNK